MSDLLTDICTDLAAYPGVSATMDGGEIEVTLDNEECYIVSLDDYEGYEDEDAIGSQPMSAGDYERPEVVKDHTTLLDAMLHFVAHSTHRVKVTGLTTDGDHNDCEAIFEYDGDPTILKVR